MSYFRGWTRLGIVISALWMLATLSAALYELIASRALLGEFMFIDFVVSGPSIKGFVPVEPRLKSAQTAALALVPVAAFWLVCLAGVTTYRWVRAGFRENEK